MSENKKSAWLRFLEFVDAPKRRNVSIPVLAVLLSLIAMCIFLLLLGKDPLLAMSSFLKGCGFLPKGSYAGGKGMITDLMSFLDVLAPMLLASLGVVVAMKAGLFNIGIAGQMLASGYIATVVIGYSGLGAAAAKPLVILTGIVVGGLMGALVGFLKYRFNIHEVVSTIMINYIVSYVTGFCINTYYADMISRSSKVCSSASRLTITGVPFMGYSLDLPMGIVIALLMVFVVKYMLEKTVLGFEIRCVGANNLCSRYIGINVGRNVVTAMAFSGVLAGLAGVTYYLGYYNTIIPKDLASMGYDSIAVALLGNNSPIGTIFASILITIFQKGNVYMSSQVEVPREIASVITGILLLFSACGAFIWDYVRRRREHLEESYAESLVRTARDPSDSEPPPDVPAEGKGAAK